MEPHDQEEQQSVFKPPPPKKKKSFIEIQREKEANKKFLNTTRVSLGVAFARWRDLKELKSFKTDAIVAEFLLDSVAEPEKSVGDIGEDAFNRIENTTSAVTHLGDVGVNEQSTFLNQHSVYVDVNCLLQLFKSCGRCSCCDCVVKWQGNIWSFSVIQHCQLCNQLTTWKSQNSDTRKTSIRNENRKKELHNGQERLCDSETDTASSLEECHVSKEVTVVAEMEVTIDNDASNEEDQEEMETLEEEEEEVEEESCLSDPDFDPGIEERSYSSDPDFDPEIEEDTLSSQKTQELADPSKTGSHGERQIGLAAPEGGYRIVSERGSVAIQSSSIRGRNHGSGHEEPGNAGLCATEKRVIKSNLKIKKTIQELCPDCGVVYKINKHQHKCEHKKPFPCLDCGKRFWSDITLKAHRTIVHHDNHQCRYCLKSFRMHSDKLNHEKNHSSEDKRSYKGSQCICSICFKKFTSRHRLQRHEVSHDVEKPHRCKVCERMFAQASQLKSHLRVHTGERPFQCKFCLKSFNHNISLKNHTRRYHLGESDPSSDPDPRHPGKSFHSSDPDPKQPEETFHGPGPDLEQDPRKHEKHNPEPGSAQGCGVQGQRREADLRTEQERGKGGEVEDHVPQEQSELTLSTEGELGEGGRRTSERGEGVKQGKRYQSRHLLSVAHLAELEKEEEEEGEKEISNNSD